MNKIIRIIQNYLILSLPFVVACMGWQTVQSESYFRELTGWSNVIWHLLAFNLMFWFSILVIYLVLLVIVPKVRDKTLRRLANLKERDEREQYITGKAARVTYISTISLMILLFFFSVFSLKISKISQAERNYHNRVNVSMGVQFGLLEKISTPRIIPNETIIFESKRLSTAAVILILLIWQLVIFNLSARKAESRE